MMRTYCFTYSYMRNRHATKYSKSAIHSTEYRVSIIIKTYTKHVSKFEWMWSRYVISSQWRSQHILWCLPRIHIYVFKKSILETMFITSLLYFWYTYVNVMISMRQVITNSFPKDRLNVWYLILLLRGCLHQGHELSQGPIKFVVGCWTCLGTTLVYTKEKMSEWPWSSRSPKDILRGLDHPLTWSNGFCNGRGKRGVVVENNRGPWQRNVVMINLCWGR